MTKTAVEAATMTDLESLDTVAGSNAGTEHELLHPTTKKKTGIFVKVIGKHSDTFREIVRERTNARVQKAAEASKAGAEVAETTAEEIETRAVELLAACTLGWRSESYGKDGQVIANEPIILFRGEKLHFNGDNAKRIYRHFIWMREQVDTVIGDLSLFIKA